MANPLVRDLMMTVYDAGFSTYYSLARTVGLVDFPVPPMSNMRKTSSPNVAHYLETGMRTALPVQAAATRHGYCFDAGTRVLDLGAGVGRQLKIYTAQFPQVEFHACDVEPSHVNWLKKHYPKVTSQANAYLPPLNYENDAFDFVYSVATFTHMAPAVCDQWLGETARLLRPGGIACFTVIGVGAMRSYSQWFSDADVAALEANGIHHTDYDIAASRAVFARRRLLKYTEHLAHCGDGYGQTFFSKGHIEANWPSSGLEIVDIEERAIDNLQDLIIMRKPG